MVETVDLSTQAAWKIANLTDYSERLERAVERLDALVVPDREAAITVYEAVLMKSGRSREEVRAIVEEFCEDYSDEEESLTIPRVSGLMGVQSDRWFFDDDDLRSLTGKLLGQFQHRVAQYNYISEREVLKRWADSYDTRLFIRRRIYDTEPVVGVVAGFDLAMLQYLRVIAGGDTLVPTAAVSVALTALGYDESNDPYETLARAEGIALRLELPVPLVGELLEEFAATGFTAFPEPPEPEPSDEDQGDEGDPEPTEEEN